tara:strand:- start:14 stop:496 length:483 start_codon:yes stop_codon:yes gene_type:complete
MFIKEIENKILSNDSLSKTIDLLRKSDKKVVFTNGCFDLLHSGHLKLLKKAKSFADVLIVGINSDSSVRVLKGEGRPVVNQEDRLVILACLKIVDFVIIFEEETPLNLIKCISPSVLVKGGDYKLSEIVGGEHVIKNGGKVKIVKLKEGYSTSKFLKKIK